MAGEESAYMVVRKPRSRGIVLTKEGKRILDIVTGLWINYDFRIMDYVMKPGTISSKTSIYSSEQTFSHRSFFRIF